jgi:peptidoglycan hydrolase-like protein with peptidoglycan-binding domain
MLLSSGVAHADPPAADWATLRMCESSNRYDIDTHTGYYGAYQFDLATWRSVGGTGVPSDASPAEQDYRALYLYRMRGWQPWTCATLRGLVEDSSARSKVVPSYADSAYIGGSGSNPPPPQGGGSGSNPPSQGGSDPGAPAYPGHPFYEGDTSPDLAVWQLRMGSRGYGLTGTGYFGPKTKAVVLLLQREAGLQQVGFIGPNTWAAAWASSSGPSEPVNPPGNSGCSIGSPTAPPWPGVTFNPGDTSSDLQCWQKQMGHRGYGLVGTGYYGPATYEVVVALQARNGLRTSGIVGPKTWVAAWEGL